MLLIQKRAYHPRLVWRRASFDTIATMKTLLALRTRRQSRYHRALADRGPVLWLARRTNRRSLRTPLGNRQALGRRLTRRVWVYLRGLDLISQSRHSDCFK